MKSSGQSVAFVDVDVHQPPGDAAVFEAPPPPTGVPPEGGRLVAQGRCVYSVRRTSATTPADAYPIG